MKLFWKDQLPLVLFFIVQMLLVPLLYWLTGEGRPMWIMLYGVLLSGAVLLVYLGFRYFTHRTMYKELSSEELGEEFFNPALGDAPLPEAVHERITHYERLYREQLHRHQSRTEQHLTFMNRWVHQMKTPISVIQLSISELEDDRTSESIREELERIRKGLDMVLYTARLEHFEHDFAVESIGLRKLASEAVVENRKLFIRKGITPKFAIDNEIQVYTDAKWFRFMLGQILINAVNYSGGPGKEVHLAAEDMGEHIKLHIRDQGIGIAPEDINRVFHPYFTGERGRQYHESTGMGLYLVQEIAGKLGHEVELESILGQGTTISLTLRKAKLLHNEGTS